MGETLTTEIMPPKRSDLILAADVPHVELDVLVGDRLDVESDSGDGSDVLAELELVEDGGLAGGIEPQHQQPHLLRSEDLAHHLGELPSHLGSLMWRRVEGVAIRAREWDS